MSVISYSYSAVSHEQRLVLSSLYEFSLSVISPYFQVSLHNALGVIFAAVVVVVVFVVF